MGEKQWPLYDQSKYELQTNGFYDLEKKRVPYTKSVVSEIVISFEGFVLSN